MECGRLAIAAKSKRKPSRAVATHMKIHSVLEMG